eukprot:1736236-Alexandrium_andersonii.AAC.1
MAPGAGALSGLQPIAPTSRAIWPSARLADRAELRLRSHRVDSRPRPVFALPAEEAQQDGAEG